MDDQQPKLYPAWKQTLADVVASGIQPGQTIDKEWLEQSFGIQPAKTVLDYEKNHHLFRHAFWRFRQELLERHQLMLRAVPGVGYEVISPENQTNVALRDRGNEVARTLEKLQAELIHVRHDALTDAQRAENANALAMVGQMAALAGQKLRIKE